jgi:mannose-6-phosphate isomerase-like protein (cupin superfamily)
MGTVEVRSMDKPDETREFAHGKVEMTTVGGTLVGRAQFKPGWRWSNDVKPIAGTEKCMFHHEGYCISGSATVQAEDGSESQIGPGDAYVIEPGHDAWVVGDETWVTVDFSQTLTDYGKPKE